MTPAELNAACQRPGHEGVLFRLYRAWNLEGVDQWLEAERKRGTSPHILAQALAEMMAGACLFFARGFTDKRRAMADMMPLFETAFRDKLGTLSQNRTPGGILLPMQH